MGKSISLLAVPLLLSWSVPAEPAPASNSASPGVWVVSQSVAADFSELSDAVAAAAEGDTIWVRDGSFGPVVIIDKGLSIASLRPDRVHVDGVDVRDLAAGKVVALSGLGIYRSQYLREGHGALAIERCLGSVRVQDCITGIQGSPGTIPVWGVGLSVRDSYDVAVADCSIHGGGGADLDALAGSGVYLRRARVSMSACRVLGAAPVPVGDDKGRPGVLLDEATLFASQSEIRGGEGPEGYFCYYMNGGDGLVASGESTIHTLDTEIHGGSGGLGYCTFWELYYGGYGEDLVLGPGVTLKELPTSPRSWSCENVSFGGESFAARYLGMPGDRVYLVRGTAGGYELRPDKLGTWLLASPGSSPASLGTAANGVLSVQVPLVDLQAPAGEGSFLLQAYVVTAEGQEVWLGAGSLTVLDRQRVAAYLTPLHVDGARMPGGDGTTWGSAFDRLEDGIAAASASWQQFPIAREVWIAGGTYSVPGAGFVSFDVPHPMQLRGGFAGDEVLRAQRVPGAHPTVLSGDSLGDDGPNFANYENNADRILWLHPEEGGAVVLDALTVRGASGQSHEGGGLLLTQGGHILVVDCTIEENRALRGAGAYTSSYYLDIASVVEFQSCTIRGNQAWDSGGGLSTNAWWRVQIQNCRLLDNRSLAAWGGGLAAASWAEAPLLIQGCEFTHNTAITGAAISVYSLNRGSTRVLNCTVRDNSSRDASAAILSHTEAMRIENSILWGNSSDGVVDETTQLGSDPGEILAPHYCCIEGWSGQYGGEGNIGDDPLLQPDGRLGVGSAAIDAGDNGAVAADSADLDGDGLRGEPVPIDLAGNPRFVDDPAVPDSGIGPAPVVDMGARERQP